MNVKENARPDFGARQDVALRELHHRCRNDLHLVVSLLLIQSKKAHGAEARIALADAADRVRALAHARAALDDEQSLLSALRAVVAALDSQAEAQSILIKLNSSADVPELDAEKVATLALAVNELATNAIKHAFEEGESGRITVSLSRHDEDFLICVDDDGLPFPDPKDRRDGLGLNVVRRMVESVGGSIKMPEAGSKIFEIRL